MTVAWVCVALALAALGHGFLWTGAVNRLHGCAAPRRVVKSLTLLFVFAFVALPAVIAALEWPQQGSAFNPFATDRWTAWYLWACAAIGAASLVVKPWVEWRRWDSSVMTSCTQERRDVVQALGSRPLAGSFARALGRLPGNECTALAIDRKRLVVPRLPRELDGLTIAHLSDLHMTGRVGREYFSYMTRQVNDLRPDVIAITGDIIESEKCWPWLDETLGPLCAPLGVYFILGNHDAFVDADRTRATLMEAGLTCLSGRCVRTRWNGAKVTLLGNELPWMRPAPAIGELPPRPADEPSFRLVLAHSPDQFGWCTRADADLALAGHTHGGQVQLPLIGVVASPSLYGTRYACGVFRRGSTVMHVSRGLGGQTPLRWRCPPEVALLELRSGLS